MNAFRTALAAAQPADQSNRQWWFVPYDQLSSAWGAWSTLDPAHVGIVLVETPAKAARRPYHKQKLALVLANLRNFAVEQALRGVAVRHVVSQHGYADALEQATQTLGTLNVMRPAERELRVEIEPLCARGAIVEHPHTGWLTTADDFAQSQHGPPWRMDAFYRHVRKQSGVLMTGGKPEGGRFSHDGDNRLPWPGDPPAPTPPTFEPNAITAEVLELVATRFAKHPGRLDGAQLPATHADAVRLWTWALEHALPQFGPFEDAMSTRSTRLFHTGVSALLNLGRLNARRLVADVARAPVPLQSREGFVRQVLGWREYVRHVHEATDGFGALPEHTNTHAGQPNHLGAHNPLPAAWWGQPSGLNCLDTVVKSVWDEGYSHHITRLMVLSNLATLLDVEPRALTDWFWVAYTDAYDWVVEPNVLGMGTFAVGDLMTTKPYVSGAAYIDRMSDYCAGCTYDPRSTCPVTRLYWAWLERHREPLSGVDRMKLPMASAARRTPEQKAHDAATYDEWTQRLCAAEPQGRP